MQEQEQEKRVVVIDADGTIIGTAEAVEIQQEMSDMLEIFTNAYNAGEAKAEAELTQQYFTPSKIGETSIGLFTGYRYITKTEDGTPKKLLVVSWRTKGADGLQTELMQGGVVLLEAFKTVPLRTPIVVTYLGKSGRALKFGVQVFNPALFKK